ncbi:MAG: N-acetylmuramoyl-L-alanine amidase [Bacillota bacterium]
MKTIVIDPGHGGKDPGAVGFGLMEKDFTLKISKRIANELLPYECTVSLTRRTDSYISLSERAESANRLKADFFVSIHINAGQGTGFESYIYRSASVLSEQYRDIIHGEVVAYLKQIGLPDRGKKKSNFTVLRATEMPSALLECLFLDTQSNVNFLKSEPFIAGFSYAIARGIAGALSIPRKNDPWNPAGEISRLLEDGIMNTPREHLSNISWGELATVLNRVRGVAPPSISIWNPKEEISLLIRDKIINMPKVPNIIVLWGEFATVLNRLRKRPAPSQSWNPAEEIKLLIDDRLLFTPREPSIALNWGEFATVINRYR